MELSYWKKECGCCGSKGSKVKNEGTRRQRRMEFEYKFYWKGKKLDMMPCLGFVRNRVVKQAAIIQ